MNILNMDMVPVYLKEIAYNCVQKKKSVIFDLKCTCGNETFKLMKGKTNELKKREEQWDKYWKKYRFIPILAFGDAIERKSGKRYWFGRTFFDIRIGKFYTDDSPAVMDLCVVKAICSNCGKEHILFDNRNHGYDTLSEIVDTQRLGVVGMPFADESLLKFRACQSKNCSVKVAVQNTLTMEDFYETFGDDATEECYSLAFSWITIISTNEGKSRTVLDLETA